MPQPLFPPPPDRVEVRRALVSVSDKAGLIALAEELVRHGVEIVSSGGTAQALAEAGIAARDVSAVTGFPEILDGRVKTLHPKVHGGILAVRNAPEHERALVEHGIAPFDLVVVSLYPFEKMVEAGADEATLIETIDIGGPALIRAAAKNHGFATVLVDPEDYAALLAELADNAGATTLAFRRRLAAKAFARTAAYDATIANWIAAGLDESEVKWRAFAGRLSLRMRYGENPHQSAAFYRGETRRPGVATATQLQGKALSYNNLADTDAALEVVCEFDPARSAAVAIVKHANPCGVAEGESLVEAYDKALRCDPVSAFGGIVAVNRTLDALAARRIVEVFTEVIVAPAVDEEAAEVIAAKKTLRLLVTHGLPDPREPAACVRSVSGGFLVQGRDNAVIDDLELKVVTKRAPTEHEWRDLRFAWRVVKHVRSNAIVYARDAATVGIGAGQMSRVDAARIAAEKAAEAAKAAGEQTPRTAGSVVASDAFFPFLDGLLVAAGAGATAVIQPGGSVRDAEVIRAADEEGVAMVFTGVRHFRH